MRLRIVCRATTCRRGWGDHQRQLQLQLEETRLDAVTNLDGQGSLIQ